ncbi:MAG: hypothetical protein AAB926_01600 [Patescibacteria group bacterium]
MNQECLTEPPGDPPGETLKKIIEAVEQNPLARLCLCLDGANLECRPPDTLVSKTKQGDTTTIKVRIKKTPNGQEVELTNEKGTIVGLRLRSP